MPAIRKMIENVLSRIAQGNVTPDDRAEARDLLEQLNALKPRYARRAKGAKKGGRK